MPRTPMNSALLVMALASCSCTAFCAWRFIFCLRNQSIITVLRLRTSTLKCLWPCFKQLILYCVFIDLMAKQHFVDSISRNQCAFALFQKTRAHKICFCWQDFSVSKIVEVLNHNCKCKNDSYHIWNVSFYQFRLYWCVHRISNLYRLLL